MLKRLWQRLLLVLVLILGLSAIAWQLWQHPAQQTKVERRQLTDGSSASLATPAGTAKAQVLLLLDPSQQLQDGELLALAQDSGARILQLSMPGNDCDAQQHRLQAATDALQHTPTLVAGIGPGAAFAWRWLATQSNDDAQALSVGFSLQQPDCAAPLPERAAHGRWNVAWNNNPDDPSAGFARAQANAQTKNCKRASTFTTRRKIIF